MFLVRDLSGFGQWDTRVYRGVARDLFAGRLPYRDRALEYPPYAVGVFVLPQLIQADRYREWFMVLTIVVDMFVKWSLIVIGFRRWDSLRRFLPLLSYSLAVPFLHHFFLQRYDVWPALVCLLTLWLFCSGRYALSGLALAAGIGLKLYPIVFLPALLTLAVRQKAAVRFTAGVGLGLLPIALSGLFVPWWRFAQFHADRGIQVESLYASVLWLLKLLGQAKLNWVSAKAMEVQGPLAAAVLPWARLLLGCVVLVSCALSAWAAAHGKAPSISRLSRLLLVPLLGFVAFNQVLSPQYMIWLLPLMAVATLEGNAWTPLSIAVAGFLTPMFYPSPTYHSGLNLPGTLVLLVRNLILIAAWGLLFREAIVGVRDRGRPACEPPTPAGCGCPPT